MTKLSYILRSAKVPRNKKWIYTLIAWVLENQDEKYQKIQSRINTSLYHNSGYYKPYYEVNRNKHNTKMRKLYKKKSDIIKLKSKIERIKGHRILKLYKQGLLSIKSTKTINKKLKEI